MNEPLSPEREQEIRTLSEAASPGPWRIDDMEQVWSPESDVVADTWEPTPESRNGDFIAAARMAVPELLAEVDRLRAKLANARSAALREAAGVVGNDDTCDCGGCDTCVPRHFAQMLRDMADQGGAR